MNDINQVATLYRSANTGGQPYFLSGNEYWSSANVYELPQGWRLDKTDCYDDDEDDNNEPSICLVNQYGTVVESYDIHHNAQTNTPYVLVNGQAISFKRVA